jgi:protein TonB
MAAFLFAPQSAISERDQVSLCLSALVMGAVWLAGQIQLSSDTETLTSVISLNTEVDLPEQKAQSTTEPQKTQAKTQTTSTPKDSLSQTVSKVDDSSESAVTGANVRVNHSAVTPAVASHEINRVDSDKEFENKIRSVIESSKRYPTGREASLQKPQGVVVACVVLLRDGTLQEMKIQRSSTYPILDNAAKRLLANLQYPPMPQDIYQGQANHSFCVNLDYKVPN